MNQEPISRSIGWVEILTPEGSLTKVRYDIFVSYLFKLQSFDLMQLHGALGVAGEAGELADAIKKHVIYGKTLDRLNVIEELGDLRFYMQALMNLYQIDEQTVLQYNARKLGERYKGMVYSDADAIARKDKGDSNE